MLPSPLPIQLCCMFMQKRGGEVVLNSYYGMLITCFQCFHKVLLDHMMPSVFQLIVGNYTGMDSLGNGWHYPNSLFAINIME